MRRALLWVDAIALLLGGIFLWEAFNYDRGTLEQPGPGFYPMSVGILLVIASLGSLVTDLLKPAQGKLDLPKGRELWRVLSVTAGTVAYVLLLPYAGHLLSAILVVFIVLHTLGMPSWFMKIGLTIAIALGSYYLFDIVLKVSLPRGIIL
jgi:putative tricarboxylic transport membrane protein